MINQIIEIFRVSELDTSLRRKYFRTITTHIFLVIFVNVIIIILGNEVNNFFSGMDVELPYSLQIFLKVNFLWREFWFVVILANISCFLIDCKMYSYLLLHNLSYAMIWAWGINIILAIAIILSILSVFIPMAKLKHEAKIDSLNNRVESIPSGLTHPGR